MDYPEYRGGILARVVSIAPGRSSTMTSTVLADSTRTDKPPVVNDDETAERMAANSFSTECGGECSTPRTEYERELNQTPIISSVLTDHRPRELCTLNRQYLCTLSTQ